MLSSRISIYSSSVSSFNSSTAALSLCPFLVEVGGISEVSRASKSSAASNNEVKSEEDVVGACEEVVGVEVPEGPKAGVGEGASIGIESTSTSGDVSTRASLLLSTSSLVYSASMHWMSVEKDGVTSKSLASSRGTLARRHNSVIRIANGKESQVDPPLGHHSSKECFLCMAHNRIVLGWHYGAANEAKPETKSNTQVPLLYGNSYLYPPRGVVENQRCQPALQDI
ncbi:hypothetical protein H5410_003176 [Solanum commersonii]|uniref:Uncharacterized protein n=1 Tax=Solanum commersonii TaxID=4109 RepID=A0A9J6B4B3_SOLCO|nr:hypothetical protein H5410_003176 [Solanum commersonii]